MITYNPPFPSRQRGGTFFTMLIFIMLLISCALMYYYFQRSRFLEREIATLKSGHPQENSGWFGWMSSGKEGPRVVTDNAGQIPPAPTPNPTPTPHPVATPVAAATATTISTQLPADAPPVSTALQPATHSEPAAPEAPGSEPEQDEPPLAKPTATPKPIESAYDAMGSETPAVRVRAPRRNP